MGEADLVAKNLKRALAAFWKAIFAQLTIGDLFCIGGFTLLGAGLWEHSRSLALCTLGGLMLIIWFIQFIQAMKKGDSR
jgi:hypothetical protein